MGKMVGTKRQQSANHAPKPYDSLYIFTYYQKLVARCHWNISLSASEEYPLHS